MPEGGPSRTRFAVALAATAVAVLVVGGALRATLTARLSSPPRRVELAPAAAGRSAPGHDGVHGRGSLWPGPNDATGESGVARTPSRFPMPGDPDGRQLGVRPGPKVSGPGVPSEVPPLFDPTDAGNAAIPRPWSPPLRSVPEMSAPGPPGSGGARGRVVPVLLFIEYNATDGDAAVQANLRRASLDTHQGRWSDRTHDHRDGRTRWACLASI